MSSEFVWFDANTPELFVIAFVAYFVKGLTGFGPAIVIVSLGSMVVSPHVIIPTSAMLDLAAGAVLVRTTGLGGNYRFWLPLSGAIVIGALIGGLLLKLIPPEPLRVVLAGAILILGVWFMFYRTRGGNSVLKERLPSAPGRLDLGFTLCGGISGGFLGISGPPILWHFGRNLAKEPLRNILIILFLAAATAQTITYTAVGLIDMRIIAYTLVCLPGVFLGLAAGNRLFVRVSEKGFGMAVGALLMIIAGRMLVNWLWE